MYTNNSVIDINLVGEGYPGLKQITDGGALECHTDDITCCRGIDNPPNGTGRGEWYYPNGTVISPPSGLDNKEFYRTRGHMVIRLNRVFINGPSGMYKCEIPGFRGVNITKYITLTLSKLNTYILYLVSAYTNAFCPDNMHCHDLPTISRTVTYTPPQKVSATLPAGQRYTGTVATYSCSPGYQLVGGSSLRACGPNGTWNGTEPSCSKSVADPGWESWSLFKVQLRTMLLNFVQCFRYS